MHKLTGRVKKKQPLTTWYSGAGKSRELSPLRSDGQREEPLPTPEEQLFWVGCLIRAVPLVEGSAKPKGGSRGNIPQPHTSPSVRSLASIPFGQTQWETPSAKPNGKQDRDSGWSSYSSVSQGIEQGGESQRLNPEGQAEENRKHWLSFR